MYWQNNSVIDYSEMVEIELKSINLIDARFYPLLSGENINKEMEFNPIIIIIII